MKEGSLITVEEDERKRRLMTSEADTVLHWGRETKTQNLSYLKKSTVRPHGPKARSYGSACAKMGE